MKKQILLICSLTLLIGNIALAQGNWVSADQNVSPNALVSSSGTLSASGSFTWMGAVAYNDANHLATLTYALPPSVYPSSGTPSLVYANTNTPVAGVTFAITGRGWSCNFAPSTSFLPGTKLIFSINNMELKDDQAYTDQKVSHFISFLSSPANETFVDNAATTTFETIVNGPLPVGLLNFDARLLDKGVGAKVDLTWTTITEVAASHFIVQRSKDAEEWLDVTSVKATGSANTKTTYQVYDEEALMGKSYYRLKQVDIDSKFTYSSVRVVDNGMIGGINIFPNPTSDQMNVQYTIEQGAQIEIKLLTVSGRVAKSILLKSDAGTHVVKMDISELASGLYEVNVYNNSKLMNTTKVQKN